MAKQVTNREKATEIVASAAEHHGEAIQEGVAAVLAPYLARGEKLPDFALGATLIARMLRDVQAKLSAVAQGKETAAAATSAPMGQRDGARDALYTKVVGVRLAVEATYGHDGSALLGKGKTPTDANALLSLAQRHHEVLANPKTKWPAALHAELSFDARASAKALEPLLTALAAELKDTQSGKREVGSGTAEKHAAMAANDEAFLHGARWLEATLRLARQPELAEQVRPSHHRPGVTGEQATRAAGAAAPGGGT